MFFCFLIVIHNCIIDPTGAKLDSSAGHSCSYSNEGGILDKGHYLDIRGRNVCHALFHSVELCLSTLCSCCH